MSNMNTSLMRELVNSFTERHTSFDIRIYKVKNMASVRFNTKEDKLHFLTCAHKRPLSFDIISPKDSVTEIDKVHAKFIKFALGVSKFTSNTAVFREMGQVPILNKAKRLALMYYYRLENEISQVNYPLLNAAYNEMKQYNHPWLNIVRSVISELGLGNLYSNSSTLDRKQFKTKVKSRLHDIAVQEISGHLSERSYLNDLVTLVKGSQYKMQNYINVVQSSSHRVMYAKIRTNSTKLSLNPYSNIHNMCDKCNVIKDFQHLLLNCKSSEARRVKFYDSIKNINPGFKNRPTSLQYREIMNLRFHNMSDCNRDSMISIVLAFVDTIYKKLV